MKKRRGRAWANGKAWAKRKCYVVKGITRRHWWDTWDKDKGGSTRQALRKDTTKRLDEA